jgi:hypothetical protein
MEDSSTHLKWPMHIRLQERPLFAVFQGQETAIRRIFV